MGVLIAIAVFIVVLFWSFIFFCALLTLRNSQRTGALAEAPKIIKAFAIVTLVVGLFLDVLLNMILSLVFLEIPRELLTTHRCARLKYKGNRWQRACARWACGVLSSLDKDHC